MSWTYSIQTSVKEDGSITYFYEATGLLDRSKFTQFGNEYKTEDAARTSLKKFMRKYNIEGMQECVQ